MIGQYEIYVKIKQSVGTQGRTLLARHADCKR